ncbi:MAG: methyltransferase [Myxococcota bacterium]
MPRRDRKPEALVLDEGVLREGPVCEIGGQLAVEACGGLVVTPWRDRHRAAEIAELEVAASTEELPDASFPQVVVHLQKSRAATAADLAEGWRILAPGGQFLFAGTNAVGVTSAVKRLAKELDQSPIVVTNRARARIVRFKKDDGEGPARETTPDIEATFRQLDGGSHTLALETRPGVFSAKKLDAGSALLLDALAGFVGHKPPKRIVDLGCGTGVLGLAAATLFPEAECLLADADARAVDCARANADALGLADRCRVEWWDAREAPLGDRFDLALVNPPFHQHGTEVDLVPALALFQGLGTWLGRSGRALVVANRTLPYEQVLGELGQIGTVASTRGYKLLSLKRSARSSSANGRRSPGARSGGRSREATRSR